MKTPHCSLRILFWTVLAHAFDHGTRDVLRRYLAAHTETFGMPCGSTRQVVAHRYTWLRIARSRLATATTALKPRTPITLTFFREIRP
jgi:hypothetical protein